MIGLTTTWHLGAEDIVQELDKFPEADDKVDAHGVHQINPDLRWVQGQLPGPFTHEFTLKVTPVCGCAQVCEFNLDC